MAARQLATFEALSEGLKQAIEETRAQASDARSQRDRLQAEVGLLKAHHEGLQRVAVEHEAARSKLLEQAANAEAQFEQARARAQRLEQEVQKSRAALRDSGDRVDELMREREMIREQVRLAADSRAWRWGHGITLFLSRITFRSTKRAGAIDALAERLEPQTHLPPGSDGAESS